MICLNPDRRVAASSQLDTLMNGGGGGSGRHPKMQKKAFWGGVCGGQGKNDPFWGSFSGFLGAVFYAKKTALLNTV